MPFLIDGHNLIGQLPDLDLSQVDDEHQLLRLLRAYARRTGRRITVYFDRGSPSGSDPRPQNRVTAHFVRPPRSADQAIADHLESLGGAAKNWTVVSSDRGVRASARRAGARSLTSPAFARELRQPSPPDSAPGKPSPPSNEDELQDWLRLFGAEDGE
ncbi:MAG: NYN domain-containing protein [Anaerolineales bacterium]|nr:NYN domain-containing protein [Anaerolineales bacterium]